MILLLAYLLFPTILLVRLTGDKQKDYERETTCWRERGEGKRVGEEPDRKKAWSSINHAILSDQSVKKTFSGQVDGGRGHWGGEGALGGGHWWGGGHSLVRPHIHTQAEKSSQTRGCISYITRPQTMYSPSAVIWILPSPELSQYRQTPIFRHPFFRKQCFSLKYSLVSPPQNSWRYV